MSEHYPEHDNTSKVLEENVQKANLNAKMLLRDEEGVEIIHFRELS